MAAQSNAERFRMTPNNNISHEKNLMAKLTAFVLHKKGIGGSFFNVHKNKSGIKVLSKLISNDSQ